MKHSNPTHDSANAEWELLGELELPVSESAESTIQAWIAKLLTPLNLPPGFLNRFVQSANEAAMRYLHPDAMLTSDHIHLSIHAARQVPAKGKTWGFFHIERMDNRAEAALVHDHVIEFYLYVEGE